MDLSLKGRTAVICGSTQGIGLAIADELAKLGANCVLLARNETQLKKAAESLDRSMAQQHHSYVADFANSNEVKQTIARIASEHEVQILINNTGGPAPGAITEAGSEQFLNAFQQHVINNQHLVQAVL